MSGLTEAEELELLELENENAAVSQPAVKKPSILARAGQMAKSAGMGVLSVLDKVAHFGQPQAAKDLVERARTDPAMAPQNPEMAAQKPSPWLAMGMVSPMGSVAAPPPGLDMRPALATAVDQATSPMTYLSLGMSRIPAIAAWMARGGKAEKAMTAVESGLTGKSMGALSQASTKAGRDALHQAALSKGDLARSLEGVAVKASDFMPEAKRIDQVLASAPDIDIRPTLQAFDQAMPKLAGEAGAGTPGMLALRNKLQAYKAAMQGKLPDEGAIAEMDFGGNLDAARAALADPESKWGILNEIAQKAAKRAESAQAAAGRAASSASSAAGQSAAAKSRFLGAADKAEKNVTRWGGERDAAGQAAEIALENAQLKAAAAKASYADAQAKAAVGQITAQDAARARAELDAANRALHVADAANEVSQGRSLEEVARGLVDRYGITGEPLADVMDRGRRFVADNSFTPAEISSKIPAAEFKRLREALDRDIDFNDPISGSLKGALKVPRMQMKNALIESAGPQYAKDMEAWSEKITDFNELRSRLGKAPSLRLNRADLLLRGADKEGNADLLSRIDKHTQMGFGEKARLARLADEFTEKARGGNILNPEHAGRPSWRPRGGVPFASMEAGGLSTALHFIGLPPPVIAAVDAAAVASTTPAFAAKVAIPAARHLPPTIQAALDAAAASGPTIRTMQGNQ